MPMPTQQKPADIVQTYRPHKSISPDPASPSTLFTSLDFDDTGDFLVAASTDQKMHIISTSTGTRTKTVASQKYGIHLARFTHHSRQVLFASTKGNDDLRLLELHSEGFLRYFSAHTAQVTCIALAPGSDNFLSCGADDTVCLWDVNSRTPQGKLKLVTPYLAAFDPSSSVMCIASQATQSLLLYDGRNYDKAPFGIWDMREIERKFQAGLEGKGWTKLEFSNDGKYVLLGTDYGGHFLLDSFEGECKAFLVGKGDGTGRAAPVSSSGKVLGQGDVAFSQDGRFVIGGAGGKSELLIWDTAMADGGRLEPMARLQGKGTNPVIAVNPRFNMIATADAKVSLWLPGGNEG